jgi:5-formaminoimidazole-4-carboxamide-1-beta-D-ribofuranosyl 5'-monophosphate synthetase
LVGNSSTVIRGSVCGTVADILANESIISTIIASTRGVIGSVNNTVLVLEESVKTSTFKISGRTIGGTCRIRCVVSYYFDGCS